MSAQEAKQAAVQAGADKRVERLMVLDVSARRQDGGAEWHGEVSLVHVEATGPRSCAEILYYLGRQGWAAPMPARSPAPPLSLMIAETRAGDSIADFLLVGGGRAWLGDTVGLAPGMGGLFQLRGANPPMVQAVPSAGSRPATAPAAGPSPAASGRRLGPADDFDY